MLIKSKVWLFALVLWMPAAAQAALDVVASSSSGGALVREVAGEHVELTILAPPDRDLHHLQARPSMLRALRGADLVVATGAELEIGWLPLAIAQAANPAIQPGRPGYFEMAAQVELLEVGGEADRALGDVHPTGNPHVSMDPVRMAAIAQALAKRLGLLDPGRAGEYQANADAFERKVAAKMSVWQERLAQNPGVVSFHKDVIYLLERFDITHLGTLEPVPGVPPSAAHISTLIEDLRRREGLVVSTPYQPKQAADRLADALEWRQVRLLLEPPLQADGDGYLAHMQQWVDALAGR